MRLDKLKEHFGDRIEIEWKAFLLRTGPRDWEHEDFVNYTNSWVHPREAEPELEFTKWASNDPQPHSSIEAQVAFKVVKEFAPDLAKAYHDRILRAYFVENRDISNAALLSELAVEVGVDADAYHEAIVSRSEAMTALVFEEYNSATAQGIHSIPTVVFEDQYPVPGAQPFETYESIVLQIEELLASPSE